MRSVDCEVWSVMCGLWSVKCEECSVKCEVWSVKCEVWSVKSAVRSVKCELELQMWHVKQDTTFAECTHARAWLACGTCKFYIWERSYISPRQLPPRLVRVLLVIMIWYGIIITKYSLSWWSSCFFCLCLWRLLGSVAPSTARKNGSTCQVSYASAFCTWKRYEGTTSNSHFLFFDLACCPLSLSLSASTFERFPFVHVRQWSSARPEVWRVAFRQVVRIGESAKAWEQQKNGADHPTYPSCATWVLNSFLFRDHAYHRCHITRHLASKNRLWSTFSIVLQLQGNPVWVALSDAERLLKKSCWVMLWPKKALQAHGTLRCEWEIPLNNGHVSIQIWMYIYIYTYNWRI